MDESDLITRFLVPSGIDLAARRDFVAQVKRYSNFPNLLKGMDQFRVWAGKPQFSAILEAHLLQEPYLGLDSVSSDCWLPVEFRLYWAMVLVLLLAESKSAISVLTSTGWQSNQQHVRNSEEFRETWQRVVKVLQVDLVKAQKQKQTKS